MSRELVQRLRQGDADAYREAVAAYGDALYAFLRRLSRNADLAQDLFQETWVALARNATRLAEDTRLELWLFTVARNAYRSHRRWAMVDVSRWLLVEPDEDVAATAPSPEEQAVAERTALGLERALGALRDGDREVLLLIAVDGLEGPEVASMLRISPETLRQRLSRARKALAQELSRVQKGEAP